MIVVKRTPDNRDLNLLAGSVLYGGLIPLSALEELESIEQSISGPPAEPWLTTLKQAIRRREKEATAYRGRSTRWVDVRLHAFGADINGGVESYKFANVKFDLRDAVFRTKYRILAPVARPGDHGQTEQPSTQIELRVVVRSLADAKHYIRTFRGSNGSSQTKARIRLGKQIEKLDTAIESRVQTLAGSGANIQAGVKVFSAGGGATQPTMVSRGLRIDPEDERFGPFEVTEYPFEVEIESTFLGIVNTFAEFNYAFAASFVNHELRVTQGWRDPITGEFSDVTARFAKPLSKGDLHWTPIPHFGGDHSAFPAGTLELPDATERERGEELKGRDLRGWSLPEVVTSVVEPVEDDRLGLLKVDPEAFPLEVVSVRVCRMLDEAGDAQSNRIRRMLSEGRLDVLDAAEIIGLEDLGAGGF